MLQFVHLYVSTHKEILRTATYYCAPLVQIASKLDVIYALSASWGESESSEDFEMLEKKLTALKPEELILVSSL